MAMKRRMSNSRPGSDLHEGPRRRRQPQISCNFCRSKKLKCDRQNPCSNCTSRGISCDGQLDSPLPGPSRTLDQGSASNADVLERLRRLEQAVFGSWPAGPDDPVDGTREKPGASVQRQAISPTTTSRRETRPGGDLDYDGEPGPSRPDIQPALPSLGLKVLYESNVFTFRILSHDECSNPRQTPVRSIDLPNRDAALVLYQDYLDNSDFHVANILYTPSMHSVVSDVYMQLRGQGSQVDLGAAALLLSYCAAAAFFWDKNFRSQFRFPSEDAATAQSVAWRAAAWELLDQQHRAAAHSVEAIQARLVLADLMYNIDGMTSRYRYLHACARVAAYELGLHVLDIPGRKSSDSCVILEMKRRVWWYIAATDWLLASMGGATDRIYTVHPAHMRVNRPHHLSGADQTTTRFGPWSETAVMQINVRIELAEICREVVDALPLGAGDIDTLPYLKIAALDALFERLVSNCPSMDALLPSPDPVSRRIALQRSVGILAVYARRARLLRPLLLRRDLPESFEIFRLRCLNSAATVMQIASVVLDETIRTPSSASSEGEQLGKPRRGPYHSGLIVNHLFMACVVVATDPSLRGVSNGPTDPGIEQRRSQLAIACRLLEKAGQKSPMAFQMVKRLVHVLRKHRVHGVEDAMHAAEADNDEPVTSNTLVERQGEQMATAEACRQNIPAGHLDPSAGHQPAGWSYDPAVVELNKLNGIWDDFLGTAPTNDAWDQLFADLDYMSNSI